MQLEYCDIYAIFKNGLQCHDNIPVGDAKNLVRKYIKNAPNCEAIRVAKYTLDSEITTVYWWKRERGWSENVMNSSAILNYLVKQSMRAMYDKKINLSQDKS